MKEFGIFFWRITSSHLITYFLAGIYAYNLLHYQDLFETPPFSYFMKPMSSLAVAAGPALQVIRGLIFTIVLWVFREVFLNTKYGWLKLWGLLLGLSILSTTAAAPGSVEGFIYTTIPVREQIVGYLEVMPQTLLFSLMVYYWYKKPHKAWNVISIVLVLIIFLFSLAALTMPFVDSGM
jgi:hypothetical protein